MQIHGQRGSSLGFGDNPSTRARYPLSAWILIAFERPIVHAVKVFLTGGTGAIGPSAIRALVQAGNQVTASARSPEKAVLIERLGAQPATASLFDQDALRAAFDGHDAVVNLATAIPSTLRYPFPRAWRENARIRSEGSANVVDAALAVGAQRLVQESIALGYPDRGAEWIDETVPLDLVPIMETTPIAEAQADRFTESGGSGVVLRFGLFYGPDSVQSREMLALARAHIGLVFGAGSSYFSPIHLEDAGAAVATALHAPPGVYNVVDDEPVTKRDFASAINAAVGARAWVRGPGRLAGLPGRNMAAVNRSHRVSNRAFRSATEWAPTMRSAWEGWEATARVCASSA
ncbi:MAG: NAD(P)-dependent oxidoreductase [Solirubrobacterales bacterium]